jgi:ribonuclease BN (tRNA processing enzyme)
MSDDTKKIAKALALLFDRARLGNADAKERIARLQARLPKSRSLNVAQMLLDIGRSLRVFYYGDKQYVSKAVSQTMLDAEAAFAKGEYDRAEHLAKVAAAIVARDAKKFVADPDHWVQKWKALRS